MSEHRKPWYRKDRPMTEKVNPIHFKPTWFLVRMPDEADEIKAAFGDGCLALSDVEMICVRIALDTFAQFGGSAAEDDARVQRVAAVVHGISEKLQALLALEFEDDTEAAQS